MSQYTTGGSGGGGSDALYPQGSINTSSTNYILGMNYTGSTNSNSVSDSRLQLAPIIVSDDVTITSLASYINTGAAGATGRFGIYSSSNGLPDALIAETGILDFSSAGIVDATVSISLTKQTLYFGAMTIDENGGNISIRMFTGQPFYSTTTSPFPIKGYYKSSVSPSSSLPATLSSLSSNSTDMAHLIYGVD